MSLRLSAALLVPILALVTCAAPSRVPASVAVDFATGSIPPPFNHTFSLSGHFEGSDLVVRYEVQYLFREGMSSEELAAQGYSEDDDLLWEGQLAGADADAWRTTIAESPIGPIPPQLPGSDSFVVTIDYTDGTQTNGAPEDRDRWLALVDAVDQRARAETGNPRAER